SGETRGYIYDPGGSFSASEPPLRSNSIKFWRAADAGPATYTREPELENAKCAAPLVTAVTRPTPSTIGTAPPVAASFPTSNGTANKVPATAYTMWPVGTNRASVPFSTIVFRAPVLSDWTTMCALSQGSTPWTRSARVNSRLSPSGSSCGPCVKASAGFTATTTCGFPPKGETRMTPVPGCPNSRASSTQTMPEGAVPIWQIVTGV